LAPELEEELRQLIEAGPDLERDGVVEYRVRHIRRLALRHFGVDYSRCGMQGRLHRMKLSYLKPRPIHPKTDPAARAGQAVRPSPYFYTLEILGREGIASDRLRVWDHQRP